MIAHAVIDIKKEVERHIGLAERLTERNEDLSAKIVDLEIALKEKNKEILAERRNVETHLETINKQSAAIEKLKNRCCELEKDMEQMKLTARETRNSSAVSDFSSAISINTKKMEQFEIEQDQHRMKLKEEKEINLKMFSEHTQLIEQLREFLQTETQKEKEQKSSSLFENLSSVMGKQNVESRNVQLITEVERILNCHDGNISRKFVFSCGSSESPAFLSSDNVECIHYWTENLDNLVHNISSYKKELLVLTWWKCMNTTSGGRKYYAKLLSLCREWKRLCPDGEIHCLNYFEIPESPSEPDKELASLLTTCNKYLAIDYPSNFSAFRQYWPEFVNSILSEETKKEYPK